jgi:hypothetical protein
MSRYRVIQQDYGKVTSPDNIGATIQKEYWRGENPPTVDERAAIGQNLKPDLPIITQERFLILQLGKRAINFGWRKVEPGAETSLPPNYQITTPTLQFREYQYDGVPCLEPVAEDTVVWKSDNYPGLHEWNQAVSIATLEAQLLAPAYGEDGEAPDAEGPIIQKNRYLKFGQKVRQFTPFVQPAPDYV